MSTQKPEIWHKKNITQKQSNPRPWSHSDCRTNHTCEKNNTLGVNATWFIVAYLHCITLVELGGDVAPGIVKLFYVYIYMYTRIWKIKN